MNTLKATISAAALLCAVLLAAATKPASQPTSTKPPVVGDIAPAMNLKTLADEDVRLADLTAKGPVVLIVLRGWVGYQCPLCTKQVGDIVAHADDFDKAGAHVVLVYPGSAAHLKEHAQDFESGKGIPANFSFVIDPDLRFVNDWGLRWKAKGETAYPSTFVVDRESTVRFAKVSHSHGDRATASEVLRALSELPK